MGTVLDESLTMYNDSVGTVLDESLTIYNDSLRTVPGDSFFVQQKLCKYTIADIKAEVRQANAIALGADQALL